MIENVNVQFSLFGKTREGEVAAPNEADGWVVWVRAMDQVKLCVEWVSKKKLYYDLAFLQLCAQAT